MVVQLALLNYYVLEHCSQAGSSGGARSSDSVTRKLRLYTTLEHALALFTLGLIQRNWREIIGKLLLQYN